jgi:hypothetical protein
VPLVGVGDGEGEEEHAVEEDLEYHPTILLKKMERKSDRIIRERVRV